MILHSFQAGRPLEPMAIFWRFVRDTLLTAGAYVLLVVVTIILRYFTELLKEAKFHYGILEGLEILIFVAGSLLVALVLIVLTVIGVIDLVASLKRALEPPSSSTPHPSQVI
jgi:hypothetical protein